MGHDGMLYSLPSREIIANSVEYMVNAHCADALVCISNCDKITPGMLMASMRLNIPVIFVSGGPGGPMEAGKVVLENGETKSVDLIDAMIVAVDNKLSDADVQTYEQNACPTCGSCSGMFTANSMNCLTEALGLALPGNGTTFATHADRKRLFVEAGHLIVDLARRYYEHYEQDDESVLPRSIATVPAFENAMSLDIAMGGLHQHGASSARRRSRRRSRLHHSRYRPPVAPGSGAVQGLRRWLPTCMSRTFTTQAASWAFWVSSSPPVFWMPPSRRFMPRRWSMRWTAGT